jgi:hypothetical protein
MPLITFWSKCLGVDDEWMDWPLPSSMIYTFDVTIYYSRMTIASSYLESPLLDELDSFSDKGFPENISKRVLIAFFI